jgi:hypothetical protein
MNNIKKIASFSLVAGMFLIAALATSAANRTAFAQNMSNQTVANQTSSAMNQTFTNQTSAEPKLTTSDVQDIRKSLEKIRKDIADGKAQKHSKL